MYCWGQIINKRPPFSSLTRWLALAAATIQHLVFVLAAGQALFNNCASELYDGGGSRQQIIVGQRDATGKPPETCALHHIAPPTVLRLVVQPTVT